MNNLKDTVYMVRRVASTSVYRTGYPRDLLNKSHERAREVANILNVTLRLLRSKYYDHSI